MTNEGILRDYDSTCFQTYLNSSSDSQGKGEDLDEQPSTPEASFTTLTKLPSPLQLQLFNNHLLLLNSIQLSLHSRASELGITIHAVGCTDLKCSTNSLPCFSPPPTPTPRSHSSSLSLISVSTAQDLADALLPPVEVLEDAIRTGSGSPRTNSTILALFNQPELLTLKQSEAARIMGMSTSVLSKRWRQATRGKKWPHRVHQKVVKQNGAS